MFTFAFLIVLFTLIITTIFDVSQTAKGIKAGVAVEGNKFIVKIFGTNKPNLIQDIIGAALLDSFLLVPAVVGLVFHNVVFFGVGTGCMLGYSAVHIRAGLAWNKFKKK